MWGRASARFCARVDSRALCLPWPWPLKIVLQIVLHYAILMMKEVAA